MEALVELAYLVAASLFIFGIKLLGSPRSAPRGNLLASCGMLIAVVATLLLHELDPVWILAGLLLGSAIGIVSAQKVKMTGMPQMVALFNGLGGGASALVAWSEMTRRWAAGIPDGATEVASSASADPVTAGAAAGAMGAAISVPAAFSTAIGALTLTGSLVAFGKLQELLSGRAITFPLQKILNGALLIALVGFAGLFVASPGGTAPYFGMLAIASVLGVLSVVPIGGADMPVVISLLNSYSGLAAAATGFVLHNNALVISGSLVGASGLILTQIMCKAMNRSLTNVLFGAFGAATEEGPAAAASGGATVKSGSAEEAAMLLEAASHVIIVPGYGMAVAQAQHVVRELADQLQQHKVDVKYAIHPVAGRMPGHMNVLLAEADVPYEQLYEMERVNPEFPQADVALVIGANDVTNPAARSDRTSPIYGMPILDVDKARTVIVLKRSLKPGFAGVDNPLYTDDRTLMVFGDAKKSVTSMIQAMKDLA